uniref:Uncharacterized protein n=1 Tax=Tanacetum cinerariifolium TaxID=118510 RepID=A0A699HK65_TANCI|nr:hypothetical protein [Tanacetum cinerariifolium]
MVAVMVVVLCAYGGDDDDEVVVVVVVEMILMVGCSWWCGGDGRSDDCWRPTRVGRWFEGGVVGDVFGSVVRRWCVSGRTKKLSGMSFYQIALEFDS